MKKPGPPLEVLIDRLIKIPDEFFSENRKSSEESTGINITAAVNDMLLDNGEKPFTDDEASACFPAGKDKKKYNYAGLAAIISYIFMDGFFTEKKDSAGRIRSFIMSDKLIELSKTVDNTDEFINDPDRREEICRLALDVLGYYPEGETEKNAADRLLTLDSVERKKILAKTMEAQKRAKELREAMLRKEAEEAASKMSRE